MTDDGGRGMGWQPIETAPKTSKAILVYVPENKCTFAVTWHKGIEPVESRADKPGWRIFGGGYRAFLEYGPSDWRPLPDPPKTAARTSEPKQ